MKIIINRSTGKADTKTLLGKKDGKHLVFTGTLKVDMTNSQINTAGSMGIYRSPLKGIERRTPEESSAKTILRGTFAKLTDKDDMLTLQDIVEKRPITYTSNNPVEVENYLESFREILRDVAAYIDMGMNYTNDGAEEEIEELISAVE